MNFYVLLHYKVTVNRIHYFLSRDGVLSLRVSKVSKVTFQVIFLS